MGHIIWDYLRSLWHYWWLCCLGFVLPINNVWKWLHPARKELHFPFWLRLTIALAALSLAQFLAYKDQTRNLENVIQEKRQLSIEKNTMAQQLKDSPAPSQPRNATKTVIRDEPRQCWVANHFGFPNSTIKGAVSATTAIIHCNYKIDAPFQIVVEFDRDFIPGATVLPSSGAVIGAGEGKQGKTYVAQINSPPLLSNHLAIVTVYGDTDKYPRVVSGNIYALK
jgi:hypothetical protein